MFSSKARCRHDARGAGEDGLLWSDRRSVGFSAKMKHYMILYQRQTAHGSRCKTGVSR